jgi:hypothetical protein
VCLTNSFGSLAGGATAGARPLLPFHRRLYDARGLLRYDLLTYRARLMRASMATARLTAVKLAKCAAGLESGLRFGGTGGGSMTRNFRMWCPSCFARSGRGVCSIFKFLKMSTCVAAFPANARLVASKKATPGTPHRITDSEFAKKLVSVP